MRKKYTFIILAILVSLYSFVNVKDGYKKPEVFPEKTIESIQDQLAETTFLDTIKVLNADYQKVFKQMPINDSQFQTSHQEELKVYLDFIQVKSVLVLIDEIENEEDDVIKKNLLFKLNVRLNNSSISKTDLYFTYRNWDLVE